MNKGIPLLLTALCSAIIWKAKQLLIRKQVHFSVYKSTINEDSDSLDLVVVLTKYEDKAEQLRNFEGTYRCFAFQVKRVIKDSLRNLEI